MRSTHWWKRSVCPAIFDRDRAALDPTRVVEPPPRECGRPLTFRQRCAVAQEPDNWSLRRLLRARREGPRRRAAEQRDEIAPLHSITSSARASSGSGTFRYGPNVLPGPTRFSHRHDPLHQPRLLAPEAHVHLAIHRRRGGQTHPTLLPPPRVAIR